ncbi:TRX3 [Sanghuangporus vaninii]
MSENITEVTSLLQLNGILAKSPNQLTVIDFHATWCGPCKMVAPTFITLAKEKPNVNFVKCDVDVGTDVARKYGIRAMPTFVFIRGGEKVHEIQGADPRRLTEAVNEYAAGTAGGTTPFAGKGQTLGGAPTPAIGTGGIINLTPQAKVLLGLIGVYVLLWYFS